MTPTSDMPRVLPTTESKGSFEEQVEQPPSQQESQKIIKLQLKSEKNEQEALKRRDTLTRI
jgi:hypothetical protein